MVYLCPIRRALRLGSGLVSVNKVLEAMRTMTPAERAQVRALLEALPVEPSPLDEMAQAKLRAAGLLGASATRATTARARHSPIEIKGKPLSDTVIEERG
jgi:hypothetical protein